MKKIITICAFAACLTGCDDLFEPAIENNLGLEYMYVNSQYAEGVLANAYTRIPNGGYSFNDVATDDAVSNAADNNWRRIASGMWTSSNNPADRWTSCRSAIQYINLFLANADQVKWANDEVVARMFCDRQKAEAYGLRAMYMYYLLEAHAGYTEDGVLMGVPIVTEPEGAGSNFNVPRNTFADCIRALKDDAQKALDVLPWEYGDEAEMQRIISKYPGGDIGRVTRVFGSAFTGRMSGKIVEAFLAKADLLAASPAYSEHSGISWETAATSAARVLNHIGGVTGVDPTGWTWYCNISDIDNLSDTQSPAEILWRGERGRSLNLEEDNYPPTLFGNGRINPTQNLVDAFPMLNGYPVSESAGNYDSAHPYDNRDPRLTAYVLYNRGVAGNANKEIITAADGTTNDALNMVNEKSTRTGYYLRKLLRQDINLDPNARADQYHYTPRIRYTEIFLAYAEAANEAYGPQGKGSNSYSAYDVVKALRNRAGIGVNNGDAYLESVKDDKAKMAELIRNERRLELCFEGFRFWDLRRWKSNLSETAKGMSISGDNYTAINVDNRSFADYMFYGPIPYSEVQKYGELKQNKGW
ncbi:RagB/SusD family nutrient uptake outer membrane protein [Bacteroides sp. UBA939]|uniref:RagB/SusD family nutrient uptake outer membrane protein n=1 Tax=Bacteroides sp. UBA939 TaxID=1946092 RepID=UPI0025C2B9B4|nr:RagB/SusD family nutrient uptake outer membrane protein [Bacteroides sp. UBA939]